MTKPDDIPQDLWDATYEMLYLAPSVHDERVAIARAIMAERKKWQQMLAELEGLSLTEVISFDRLALERSQMARDWCNFCEAIGVDVDTHETVADAVLAKFATTDQLNSGINLLVGSIIRQTE